MSDRIMLIGGPDSGKTNYLARLWQKLKAGDGCLRAPKPPSDITYVEDALAHLLQGEFAPRTQTGTEDTQRTFEVTVAPTRGGKAVELVVPDVSGELWKNAVDTTELPASWMNQLRQASGALLFLRVHSKLNIEPLDWVTSQKLLTHAPVDEAELPKGMPTQVALCELLRYLEAELGNDNEAKPRVAVVITAWDLLDDETAAAGPMSYLRRQFPLFAGRVSDADLDVRVFGVSIIGGDLADEDFKRDYLKSDPAAAGFVVFSGEAEAVERSADIALPVDWVVESVSSA